MLKRSKLQALLAIALLSLTACGGSNKHASSVTTLPPTTPVERITTTLSVTTTTTSPKVTASSRLSLDGLGGIKVGLTVSEAAAAAGVTISEASGGTDGAGCLIGDVSGGPEGVNVLTENHKIARVDIGNFGVHTASPIKTLSGIGLGSTEEEVKKAYPSIQVTGAKYDPNGHFMEYSDPTTPNRLLLFETDGKKVITFRSGRTDFVNYVEGCS